jgi:hypothetical protein
VKNGRQLFAREKREIQVENQQWYPHLRKRKNDMENLNEACWEGYKVVGGKMKNGKMVPNCVPINEEDIIEDFCPRCLATEIVRAAGQPLEEAEYHGRKVPLGKPMRGDVKKFKVFVKDPSSGNVKKVNFGDPNMRIKKSNPARRKSFRARHNCDNPGPRTKARYWSCRKW